MVILFPFLVVLGWSTRTTSPIAETMPSHEPNQAADFTGGAAGFDVRPLQSAGVGLFFASELKRPGRAQSTRSSWSEQIL
jgi:hypothetical protein